MLHSWGSMKLVCILCLQGRKLRMDTTSSHLSGQFQGDQEATLSIPTPYPIPHKSPSSYLFSFPEPQPLHKDWFSKERPVVLWSTFNVFSASSITISMSQPYLGWRVSRFPVAHQRYFFILSCFLLTPGKMILSVWSGERMQQTPREPVTQSSRGDAWLRWDSGLEFHWNRSALLRIKNTWLLLVHKCLRRFYDDQGRGSI